MLEKMVPNIQKTADLVQCIAAAMREQTVGTDQMNMSIRSLDQVIQQNAEATTQASATTASLSEDAKRLRTLIESFLCEDGTINRSIGEPEELAHPEARAA